MADWRGGLLGPLRGALTRYCTIPMSAYGTEPNTSKSGKILGSVAAGGDVFQRYLSIGLLALALTGAARTSSAGAADEPQVHVVYAGQRLGSIAKRYNVTIAALCDANGIQRRDPIHPGQRLVIPSRENAASKKGEQAEASSKANAVADSPAADVEQAKRQDAPKTPAAKTPASPKVVAVKPSASSNTPPLAKTTERKPSLANTRAAAVDPVTLSTVLAGKTHRVRAGDSLSAIAVRYDTSVKTLTQVNNLRRDQVIRVGQELVIPRPAKGNGWWTKFARAPQRPGELEVFAHKNRWKGKVVVNGRVQRNARAALSRLLGATGSAPPVPERLIQLLSHVSDTFGGRPVRLVSGYRTSSYVKDSRHRHSAAVDFSIPGVPNSAIRDYLLQLGNVGVGYYPNSSFVHLDVRGHSSYWVDYAGPGEAPRRSPRGDTRLAVNSRKAKRKSATRTSLRRTANADAPTMRQLDELAEQAVQGMNSESSL